MLALALVLTFAICACGKKDKKDLFVVARTANKSAPELQDLLAGTRLVHSAAADHVNRYGADTAGKYGYTRVGIVICDLGGEALLDNILYSGVWMKVRRKEQKENRDV